MLFNFTVELTDNDYIQFNKNHSNKSPVTKKREKILKIFTIIVFICVAAFSIISDERYRTDILSAVIYLVLYAVIAFVVLLIAKPLFRFFENRLFNTFIKMEMPTIPKTAIQFYEDFIFSVNEKGEEKVKYIALKKLDVDNNAVYVYIDTNKAYIIPLRYFTNQEHINAFCAFINSKIQEINTSK